MVRRAARASKARLAWISTRVAKACGHGTISTADVPVSPLGRLGHSLAVGIGTPPQMHELMLDTGSDLIWTQCKMWNGTVRQRDPLYDPAKSCFAAVPCNGRLRACVRHARSTPRTARGTSAFTTTRTAAYSSAMATGELASETFTFGVHQKASVRLGFGCVRLSSGNLAGASGVMGISPNTLSLISQLQIPRFSYCLTPFADRKTSRILLGAMAHLSKHKTTGPDPNHFHCEEPKQRLLLLALGRHPGVELRHWTRQQRRHVHRLGQHDRLHPGEGDGGPEEGSGEGREATGAESQSHRPLLPAAGRLVHGRRAAPLVYHFEGGAAMVLLRDNYFSEPSAGYMCLAIEKTDGRAVIGNYQQQNMHILFDVQNQKFSFTPTHCDQV